MSSPTDPTPSAELPEPELTREELVAQADVISLWDFFQEFIIENKVSLELHDCHREICDVYEAAVMGELAGIEYILVGMPTRIGKTKILEALPCWMFGEFHDPQMLYGCYSDPLVKRSISYVGRTMRSPWFINLYGDLVHTMRAELIGTIAGGTLYGAGTGGTITGFGAGLKEVAGGYISLDDPAKPDEALSKVESAKVIQNFETTWKTRRNSDKFTPIIVNAQRLGPDDLPGYIERTYPNKTLKLKFPCMVNGHSMFPETWSESTMNDLQSTRVGRYVFASQFQQEPITLGGNLIQTDSFVRYDPADALAMLWEMIIVVVDTAMKTKEVNDFSCAQAWGKLKGRAYLLDQAHGKWESPELLTTVIAFWGKQKITFQKAALRLVIEEKAAGTGLLQQLRVAGIPAKGIERDIDKVRRVQAVLPYQEAGLVYIPKEGSTPWVAGFLAECGEFKPDMTHAHDDRVDCFADGVDQCLGRPLSILELMGARPRV